MKSNKLDGLLGLQKQLLSRISREETIWSVDEGINKVTRAIWNKKVLLILDDVSTFEQLEAVLGRQKFYPGSKVIITTRRKWPLNAFKVHHEVHTISKLGYRDSLHLFSLYAFSQDILIEPYVVQSKRIVHYCGGLPLALKVLGSSLHGNTNDVWEDTICKLEAIPNPDIQKVLQISYDNLRDDKDKELFLHVVCFFLGEEKDYIVKLLSQCDLYPVVGMKNLMDRCLLYIEYGKVTMHRLIKEMGREVVRQESPKDPGKRSRLWHHDDCLNVLQDHIGTKKVEGLMLDMQKNKEVDLNLKIGALGKMQNLMLLQLNYVTFSGKYKKLPKKLRLLSWHGFSLNAIPSEIPLEKLVVLDMSCSKLKHVWDKFKVIGSLKILNLSFSVELMETPDFRGLPGLESLILKGCSSLVRVHESIACLEGLVLLDLTDCRRLREFPCLPPSLLSLQMSGCPNIGVLPGKVQCLDPISSFSLLVEMDISNCNMFDNSFPNDWSSLGSLEVLNMDGNHVTSLPKCIQTLRGLQYLRVQQCSQIQSVVGVPKSVYQLFVDGDKSLERVQLAENSRARVYQLECPKMCEIEGRYKLQSIDKVERKIIRCLGLEAIAAQGIDISDVKVLFEYGIFSTTVSEKQIPSSCSFTYRERGPQISFKVPSHHNTPRIIAFKMCLVASKSINNHMSWRTDVYNKTKKLLWIYIAGYVEPRTNIEEHAWLSVWRCGNLLEGGDEILIRILDEYIGTEFEGAGELEVDECRIKLIYEYEEEVDDGERNESHHLNAFNHISWTDRMPTDISNYVHSGKIYQFESHIGTSDPFELEFNSGLYIEP